MTQMTIESPCIGVCALDDDGRCMGCLRSADEIASWTAMSDEQRQFVVRDLERRRTAWPE